MSCCEDLTLWKLAAAVINTRKQHWSWGCGGGAAFDPIRAASCCVCKRSEFGVANGRWFQPSSLRALLVYIYIYIYFIILLFPRTLCYRAPYYVFPTFSFVFCCFFLFHCAKNTGFFAVLFWVGVWGFGEGGFGGGWVSGRSCVCVLSFRAFPFFFNGCKRFFLCAKTLFFLSGASGFVIVRAAWTVSVTFGFFWGGFWGFWVYVCYIWYIWYLWYLWYTWYLCLWYYIYIHVYMC